MHAVAKEWQHGVDHGKTAGEEQVRQAHLHEHRVLQAATSQLPIEHRRPAALAGRMSLAQEQHGQHQSENVETGRHHGDTEVIGRRRILARQQAAERRAHHESEREAGADATHGLGALFADSHVRRRRESHGDNARHETGHETREQQGGQRIGIGQQYVGEGATEQTQQQHGFAPYAIAEPAPKRRGNQLPERAHSHGERNRLRRSADALTEEREQRHDDADADKSDEDNETDDDQHARKDR